MNQINVTGRVGSIHSSTYGDENKPMLSVSIASDKYNRRKQEKETQWFRATFFNKRAESLKEHLTKGSVIHVSGELSVNTYTSNTGEERYSLDIEKPELGILHFSGDGSANESDNEDSGERVATATFAADETDDLPF